MLLQRSLSVASSPCPDLNLIYYIFGLKIAPEVGWDVRLLGCSSIFQTTFSVFILQAMADGIEKAAQDVDVFGLRVGAAEQALHSAHQAFAVAAVEEADVVHDAFHVGDHAFDLLVGGGVVFLLQVGHGHIGLTEYFITHDLNGLGEVEREIVGVAVDGHQAVARPYFFNAQAEGFVAEDEGNLFSALCRLQ